MKIEIAFKDNAFKISKIHQIKKLEIPRVDHHKYKMKNYHSMTIKNFDKYFRGQIMIILGICDSIDSHACLIKDGKIISAISEERMSRIKADTGYPEKSINRV